MLVMQNGKTVFEHYANGGGADMRCKIFSGTKSFWGIAALCAVRDGLIKLDDRVADTITEWKNDPRKSQITIRQLLNQTDGIEPAPHLHSESIRDRNAVAIQLPLVASPGSVFRVWSEPSPDFQRGAAAKIEWKIDNFLHQRKCSLAARPNRVSNSRETAAAIPFPPVDLN